MMIDVLEHIPNWEKALEELRRISNFVIFKIPLERKLFTVTLNYIKNGKTYEEGVETVGHINWFNMSTIVRGIKLHFGIILYFYFTNVFEFAYSRKNRYKNKSILERVTNQMGRIIFLLSPSLSSRLFTDFVMILAKSSKQSLIITK